ncbi:hypothetical protein, partial [Streptomyces sp. NPDC052042]|uniref:hypothetical protein n=1 Tax=Streptomyces sp. NPDC052042 TaxID=3365683 RepID=UPI0037D7B416
MSRKTLERGPEPRPVSALERLRSEIGAADRFITVVTWSCAAGMVLWSMLNATPYVRAHVAVGWERTAFVLPLVVDAAFVGALRADEIASRHGVRAGAWPVLLRLFTGASSVFLNIGGSWEKDDWTGVFQHLVAPGLLVLLAEAGPAWRRSLAAKLAAAETAEEQNVQREADRKRRQEREDADRARAQRLEDERRERAQRKEDEDRALDLEERREAARVARQIEVRRLDLEEKRITATIPTPQSHVDGMTAQRHDGTTAHRTDGVTAAAAPAPASAPSFPAAPVPVPAPVRESATAAVRAAAPVPARESVSGAVAASAPARPQVSARIPAPEPERQEEPAGKAGPVRDWDLPGLPDACAPGRVPEYLTDAQVTARIDYGLTQGWTQRRIGEFAGRS